MRYWSFCCPEKKLVLKFKEVLPTFRAEFCRRRDAYGTNHAVRRCCEAIFVTTTVSSWQLCLYTYYSTEKYRDTCLRKNNEICLVINATKQSDVKHKTVINTEKQ